ncbi:MAG: ATP-binding protein [Bacteroidetes bacterium]|nr:ATP-binding protein [Bacteroidota bacterium]
MNENEKAIQVKKIDAKYLNTCFLNIVEEPEQNLFPSSQHLILNSLLAVNNTTEANKLIMTTHSPYLINYLTLA